MKKLVLPVLYLSLCFPAYAHAYADPGSGLMMWQLFGSFLFGLLFFFKKIVSFFTGFFRRDGK